MLHSNKFEMVYKFYNTIKEDNTRMWSKQMVKNAVIKNIITKEEYEIITNETYTS